jgi:GMP synthase (glutamine-hydrolysing)
MDCIAVLDFGSQYAQLIVRRVREQRVYCELFPFDAPAEQLSAFQPRGYILSGGPASVYQPGAPQLPEHVLDSGLPILGICYGMQVLTHALGGRVAASQAREYGPSLIEVFEQSRLLPAGSQPVWMSHGDRIEAAPAGFAPVARSEHSPVAAIQDTGQRRFGLQFHPEVQHTPGGTEMIRRFVLEICGARPEWVPERIVESAVDSIRAQVGSGTALAAVSGGVDSAVAAALAGRVLGDRLTALFVDTGLLRLGEPERVEAAMRARLGGQWRRVDASQQFLSALAGVTDPEDKRRIVGEQFIRIFEAQAELVGSPEFLVQGTIYPDVVESRGPERQQAARIKTHHNVGGLPPDLRFRLVEPLRYLFKDEVRQVGLALGLPEDLLWRQPFPGPGLAVRCLGEVTRPRLERLRQADQIVTAELAGAGLLRGETAQAFAVLLPIRSVGVMGDERTYAEAVAVRAVTTEDFMTADWARLPAEVLARISNRIVNEVPGVNRVVYDVTSKPPATIEWE